MGFRTAEIDKDSGGGGGMCNANCCRAFVFPPCPPGPPPTGCGCVWRIPPPPRVVIVDVMTGPSGVVVCVVYVCLAPLPGVAGEEDE